MKDISLKQDMMSGDIAEGMMKIRDKGKKIPVIVIAEDHAGMRNSLKKWLSTIFQYYEIRDAGTGEDTVELCKKTKPEVVVMDIKLPGINGIEATRQIKKILPDTKIIVLTIYDIPVFQVGAHEAGASAFISKNNMYKELIPAIQKLISHAL
jgi:DNA-binding NarL/FixJ family response regulator